MVLLIPLLLAAQTYHGFVQHDFKVVGLDAMLVEPKTPRKGKPWIWRMEFFDHRPELDLALLDRGFFLAHIEVGNTHGCPAAMEQCSALYRELVTRFGLSKKPILEGFSRGGLYAYNWAVRNPDKVAAIYGDAPVYSGTVPALAWVGGCTANRAPFLTASEPLLTDATRRCPQGCTGAPVAHPWVGVDALITACMSHRGHLWHIRGLAWTHSSLLACHTGAPVAHQWVGVDALIIAGMSHRGHLWCIRGLAWTHSSLLACHRPTAGLSQLEVPLGELRHYLASSRVTGATLRRLHTPTEQRKKRNHVLLHPAGGRHMPLVILGRVTGHARSGQHFLLDSGGLMLRAGTPCDS